MTQEYCPFVWAHRGARSVAPENTLLAAAKAADLGADGWEFDVRLSADGELVIAHDLGLRRTSDIVGHPLLGAIHPHIVHQFSLEQLKRLSFGSYYARRDPFGMVASGDIGAEELQRFAAESLPTLAEAFDLSEQRGLKVNVEIKDMDGYLGDSIVDRVAAEIRSRNFGDSLIVSSFNLDYLKKMRTLMPSVKLGYLVSKVPDNIVSILDALGDCALHPGVRRLTREQARAALDSGHDVNVYTVNAESDMRRMMEWGVTGIITDFPQRLRPMVEAAR